MPTQQEAEELARYLPDLVKNVMPTPAATRSIRRPTRVRRHSERTLEDYPGLAMTQYRKKPIEIDAWQFEAPKFMPQPYWFERRDDQAIMSLPVSLLFYLALPPRAA